MRNLIRDLGTRKDNFLIWVTFEEGSFPPEFRFLKSVVSLYF